MGQGQPGLTPTTIVSAAPRTRTVDAATAVNTSDDVVECTVHLVTTGAAQAANAIEWLLSLHPGERVHLGLINQCIQPNATIVATASAAAAVTITISGQQQ